MRNSWICDSAYSFSDKFFCKIYDFFLIKTPVDGVSVRGISFKKRNFKRTTEVLNKMKKISPSLFSHFVSLDENENIEEALKMNGIFNHLDIPFEYAIYKKLNGLGKTESFFYCIRCALAHGSFCIHKYQGITYYYFENIYNEKTKKNNILNARMIIKENTLLEIIKFCNSKI